MDCFTFLNFDDTKDGGKHFVDVYHFFNVHNYTVGSTLPQHGKADKVFDPEIIKRTYHNYGSNDKDAHTGIITVVNEGSLNAFRFTAGENLRLREMVTQHMYFGQGHYNTYYK
jgi:hypothetical protein